MTKSNIVLKYQGIMENFSHVDIEGRVFCNIFLWNSYVWIVYTMVTIYKNSYSGEDYITYYSIVSWELFFLPVIVMKILLFKLIWK